MMKKYGGVGEDGDGGLTRCYCELRVMFLKRCIEANTDQCERQCPVSSVQSGH